MSARESRRKEERKYKRLSIRYGTEQPSHSAIAIKISTTGVFLTTNRPIYSAGSRIVIQFKAPGGTITLPAIVRHSKNIPPQLAPPGKNGMGVEFVSPPSELQNFLASL